MKIFLKYSKSEVNLWGFASDFFDVFKVWKCDKEESAIMVAGGGASLSRNHLHHCRRFIF